MIVFKDHHVRRYGLRHVSRFQSRCVAAVRAGDRCRLMRLWNVADNMPPALSDLALAAVFHAARNMYAKGGEP
ncbi:MAG: hypothetical protein AAGJ46_20740 [Planctomycetota bacterium]